jgi:hypothetical protein
MKKSGVRPPTLSKIRKNFTPETLTFDNKAKESFKVILYGVPHKETQGKF